MPIKKVVFLCGARDFHAMDWYKSAKYLLGEDSVSILTDLIGGEGFNILIEDGDIVDRLFIIDQFLLRRQSKWGDHWRNIVKLLVLPLQVALLKRFAATHPTAIFHAHSMYYLWLGWLAGVRFIGTPQGSDILVKPDRSLIYRWLSIRALHAATHVTVDSGAMRDKILSLSGVRAQIIQNGVDIQSIAAVRQAAKKSKLVRTELISVRAITPLYRTLELIEARNSSRIGHEVILTFLYPFSDKAYKDKVKTKMKLGDRDIGRVSRQDMFALLSKSKGVFSIPYSDSSPRSVYEAIFCGAPVCVTDNQYIGDMTPCMQRRVVVVDIKRDGWFEDAVKKTADLSEAEYEPSAEALNRFDERNAFKPLAELFELK